MTDYWDQASIGATEETDERKAENRQRLMDNCGSKFYVMNPQTGKMTARYLLCHQQECDNCLGMRVEKEIRQLEKGMVDFGTIRMVVIQPDENPAAFTRRLGRTGITKDMRRRLPQEDGSTVILFASNGTELGGRIITADEIEDWDWKQLARRPAGTRTSGALGAEPREDNKDDRTTLKVNGVSSNANDDQEDEAKEKADKAIAGIKPTPDNVEALCNMWAAEFADALSALGCEVTTMPFYIRCDLDAIEWKNDIASNQPRDESETSNAAHWLYAYSEI